jgi:hypothetical protein
MTTSAKLQLSQLRGEVSLAARDPATSAAFEISGRPSGMLHPIDGLAAGQAEAFSLVACGPVEGQQAFSPHSELLASREANLPWYNRPWCRRGFVHQDHKPRGCEGHGL